MPTCRSWLNNRYEGIAPLWFSHSKVRIAKAKAEGNPSIEVYENRLGAISQIRGAIVYRRMFL